MEAGVQNPLGVHVDARDGRAVGLVLGNVEALKSYLLKQSAPPPAQVGPAQPSIADIRYIVCGDGRMARHMPVYNPEWSSCASQDV